MNFLLVLFITSLLISIIFVFTKIYEFNRLRKMYVNKFIWYKNNHYVHDSYCNIYIEMFSKFRYHMFVKFVLYNAVSIYSLTDNKHLYQNFRISRQKKQNMKISAEQANNVFLYWRDQTK